MFSLSREINLMGTNAVTVGYYDLVNPQMTAVYDSALLKIMCLAFASADRIAKKLGLRLPVMRLRKFLDKFKPDLILTFFARPDLEPLSRRMGFKLVYWIADVPKPDTIPFATSCDLVITCLKGLLRILKDHGISARWLPAAYDPFYFHPMDLPSIYPVVFIGTYYPEREPVFRRWLYPLVEHYAEKIHIFGPGWRGVHSVKRASVHGTVDWRIVPKIYSSAQIVLDFYHPMAKALCSLSSRTIEALACKAFLISNHVDENLLTPGHDLVLLSNRDNICDLVDFYSTNQQERRKIAKQGHEKVTSNFTVRRRAAELLNILKSL